MGVEELKEVPVILTGRLDRTLLMILDLDPILATTGNFLQEPSFWRCQDDLGEVPAAVFAEVIWV